MTRIRIALVLAMIAALSIVSLSPASAASTVTVNGQTRALNGTDVYRAANYLVMYTPAKGASTGTNQYGYEAAVVDGKVTKVESGIGNMAIPSTGFVLSGHGDSRTWLQANATLGATVTLDSTSPPSSGTALLPDVGIRTLRQFSIVNTGGRKLLKFPGVTANVGKGPLEVRGTRSSSTSTDWTATQVVRNSDGTTIQLPSNVDFYFAGDGHSHWHMRDFDGYQLFDPSGHKLREGEKHGFCFEDNTSYRDWPSTGRNGAPASPVYTHETSCGVGHPEATSIVHGLSVGWSDTYPATLPDQAIDVTGLADGNYRVVVTADQFGGIRESNESNNSASAIVKITGSTVTLVSATDGL